MQKIGTYLACAGLLAALFAPGAAEAKYESDSDTDVEVLDYIENQRRSARENRLSDAQKALVRDAKAMRENLRAPVDPSRPAPMAIEGDDLFYDEASGDVYARGDVRVTSLDARRFESEEARGNLVRQEVSVDGKAHMIQMTPGQERAELDGYRLAYHYDTQTGKMEEAKGKLGHYYIYGRRIEFYPKKTLVYDGYMTRCGAKTPDYRISGDFIEVYPQKEALIYQAKYWIKNRIVYARDYFRVDLANPNREQNFPRFGYSSSDGVWIAQKLDYDLAKRLSAFADFKYYSRLGARDRDRAEHGFRNVYGMEWRNAGNYATVQYGHYEDGDDNWIKKEPTFIYQYTNKVGDWPFSYTLGFEEGRWTNRGVTSTHRNYSVTLSRHTITMGPSWRLNANVGYSVTKESYNRSTSKGFSYNATLFHDMGPYVTAYAGYHYSAVTVANSLFNYNAEDYARRLDYGISVALTPRDRIVFGQERDMEARTVRDIDYYWFHDMHCAQFIVRYRAKRESWHMSWAFTPW